MKTTDIAKGTLTDIMISCGDIARPVVSWEDFARPHISSGFQWARQERKSVTAVAKAIVKAAETCGYKIGNDINCCVTAELSAWFQLGLLTESEERVAVKILGLN